MNAAEQSRPYPGLAPFADTDVDRALFFGRSDEIEALLHLVLSEPLTVLYSRSGLGKSSLINAGIAERLRQRDFLPVITRIGFSQNPVADIKSSFIQKATALGITVNTSARGGHSLWAFFTFSRFTAADGRQLRPVLILDQFEEVFTHMRAAGTENQFVTELADLARGRIPEAVREQLERQLDSLAEGEERNGLIELLYGTTGPDVKILLSLREDYLPELESLREQIPTIFHAVYRLEPMKREQAREAIEKPAAQHNVLGAANAFRYAPGVVDEILDFLSGARGQGSTTRHAIDPAQLQILCDRLNRERIRRRRDEITHRDLRGFKGMGTYLRQYYGSVLRRFRVIKFFSRGAKRKKLYRRPRRSVRQLCERGLMTPAGNRTTLVRSAILERYDLTGAELDRLVDLRLLRADWRLDSQYFELSHDAWVAPIKRYARWRLWEYGTYAPRLAIMGAGCVGILFAALLIFALVMVGYLNRKGYRQNIMNAPPADRAAELGKIIAGLVNTERPQLNDIEVSDADLSNQTLHQVTFNKAKIQRAKFTGASIDGTRFEGAHLPGASFFRARISESYFNAAHLEGASFIHTNLTRVDFTGAHLNGADFSIANIAANFAGANLSNATFVDVVLDEETSFQGATINDGTSFTGTAWWLASGWSDEQFRVLRANFTPERAARSAAFQIELNALNAQVAEASRRDRAWLAAVLNNRAFFLSTRGVNYVTALEDVEESLNLRPDPITQATKGYLLLQLGRCGEAQDIFRKIASNFGPREKKRGESAEELATRGEMAYQIALAHEYGGATADAASWYETAAKFGYTPTYERLFTPRGEPRCQPSQATASR